MTLTNSGFRRSRRATEAIVAGSLLVVSSPILGALAVLLRLRLGRPILFRQERTGLGGRAFSLWKLRTMHEDRDATGSLLPDDRRLTGLGRWLRSTSLDELPELWNVIRGDMSLVGPRPLPVSYLGRYSAEESRRHEVRPGLTGWAQVNGRNSTPWDERLAMDVWYVDNRSWCLDLRILARTVPMLIRRVHITAEGHATMHELRPPAPQ